MQASSASPSDGEAAGRRLRSASPRCALRLLAPTLALTCNSLGYHRKSSLGGSMGTRSQAARTLEALASFVETVSAMLE
jgi:hypothetical protein